VAGAPLRVGIRIPPCEPVDRLVRAVRAAEGYGFDAVWMPDSPLLWRDVFGALTAAALGTERIGLGTAVTTVTTRHPAVIASAARTIAELAPGRFTLGLGVGDSSVVPLGLRASTRAELTAGIAQVRALLAGDEWPYGDGTGSRLRDPMPGVAVHLAASGPRNLRLAGEIADGVILLSGVSPQTLAAATEQVRGGLRAAGRRVAGFSFTVSAYCQVTDDVAAAARQLKPICARIAQNGGAPFLALAGIELDVPPVIEGVYPDLVHAEDWARAVELCSPHVSDEAALRFAREFCLFGTPAEIVEQLGAARAAGATGVFLQHVGSYTLPHELIEVAGAELLPALGAGWKHA
jgi:5,10-methylenetetrahydromethanopterin reductase